MEQFHLFIEKLNPTIITNESQFVDIGINYADINKPVTSAVAAIRSAYLAAITTRVSASLGLGALAYTQLEGIGSYMVGGAALIYLGQTVLASIKEIDPLKAAIESVNLTTRKREVLGGD